MSSEITEQILNDLKTANQKVVNTEDRMVSAMDILLALSTVNSNSFHVVVKHVDWKNRKINAKKWLDLCDMAGI